MKLDWVLQCSLKKCKDYLTVNRTSYISRRRTNSHLLSKWFSISVMRQTFHEQSKLSGNVDPFLYHWRGEESIPKCQISLLYERQRMRGYSVPWYSIIVLKMQPEFHGSIFIRDLVVEQFKCWHCSMKQFAVSFTYPFPSDLCSTGMEMVSSSCSWVLMSHRLVENSAKTILLLAIGVRKSQPATQWAMLQGQYISPQISIPENSWIESFGQATVKISTRRRVNFAFIANFQVIFMHQDLSS